MSGFKESVLAETSRLCQALDSHEVLARDDQLRVYRRVFYQARSNDHVIDANEAAILGVLRQELDIAQAEHFLLEHHADLREFWQQDEAFVRELHALRSAGLVYLRDGKTLIPEDLAAAVRQVLGVDMSPTCARRLYGYLSNQDLYEALAAIEAPTSGSKEERIERLLSHMAQPRAVLRLRSVGLDRLRDVCKEIGANVSGAKDELVDRIVTHIATGRDIYREPEPPPRLQEQRRLEETRFTRMFSGLRGHELANILGQFELRRGGSKSVQVGALWEAHLAEETLLNALSSADLEGFLRRLDLKAGGSKVDRIERLIGFFASTTTDGADQVAVNEAVPLADHPTPNIPPLAGE